MIWETHSIIKLISQAVDSINRTKNVHLHLVYLTVEPTIDDTILCWVLRDERFEDKLKTCFGPLKRKSYKLRGSELIKISDGQIISEDTKLDFLMAITESLWTSYKDLIKNMARENNISLFISGGHKFV